MSGKQAGLVWGLELSQPKRLVLLALADCADPDGGNVFPSVGLIAWKCGYSVRHTQRLLAALVQDGLLECEGTQPHHRTNTYRLHLERGTQKPPYRGRAALPKDPKHVAAGRQAQATHAARAAQSSSQDHTSPVSSSPDDASRVSSPHDHASPVSSLPHKMSPMTTLCPQAQDHTVPLSSSQTNMTPPSSPQDQMTPVSLLEDQVMQVSCLPDHTAPVSSPQDSVSLVTPSCPHPQDIWTSPLRLSPVTALCHPPQDIQMSPDPSLEPSRLLFSSYEEKSEPPRGKAGNRNFSANATASTRPKENTAIPPAVQVFRSVRRQYPRRELWRSLDEAIGGEAASLQRWQDILVAWVAHGYNPTNIAGCLDWFRGGGVPPRGNGPGYGPPRPSGPPAQRAIATLEEVLANRRQNQLAAKAQPKGG